MFTEVQRYIQTQPQCTPLCYSEGHGGLLVIALACNAEDIGSGPLWVSSSEKSLANLALTEVSSAPSFDARSLDSGN